MNYVADFSHHWNEELSGQLKGVVTDLPLLDPKLLSNFFFASLSFLDIWSDCFSPLDLGVSGSSALLGPLVDLVDTFLAFDGGIVLDSAFLLLSWLGGCLRTVENV